MAQLKNITSVLLHKMPVACDHVACEGLVAYREISGWLMRTGHSAAQTELMAWIMGQTRAAPWSGAWEEVEKEKEPMRPPLACTAQPKTPKSATVV